MPKIKFDHVVSFTSEDPNYPASNLLNDDPKKPWKSQTKGELTINTIIQLEKAMIISSIDIGNEHSAFVEVLVARSTAKENDYKVLLVTSSFMTPLESRQSTNPNRVRMFTADQLSTPVSTEKWDRIKIVCTQPFNKQVQYGLSFVALHSPQESASSSVNTIGTFKIRPPSPNPYKPGKLFEMRKELEEKDTKAKTAAAAIRDIEMGKDDLPKKHIVITPAKPKRDSTASTSTKAPPKARNRDEIFYDEDDKKPHDKIDKIIEKDRKNKAAKAEEEAAIEKKKPIKTPENTKTQRAEVKTKRKNDEEASTSSSANKKSKKTSRLTKPFHELMKDVVLVISGIQNPDRAVLRTLAIEMGSRYKPDWDSTCTHLICAFPNTPKFNQVRGKGKIVTRKWIEDSHSKRKRFPWRRYALDKNDIGKSESEEEIDEVVEAKEIVTKPEENSDEDEVVVVESYGRKPEAQKYIDMKSDSDTNIEENKLNENGNKMDPFGADTEEEEMDDKIKNGSSFETHIPEIFEQKMFFIDCDLEESKKQLERYIEALNGIVIHEGCDIDYIITNKSKCCAKRQEIEKVNSDVISVRPEWIWDCYKNKTLLPYTSYTVF